MIPAKAPVSPTESIRCHRENRKGTHHDKRNIKSVSNRRYQYRLFCCVGFGRRTIRSVINAWTRQVTAFSPVFVRATVVTRIATTQQARAERPLKHWFAKIPREALQLTRLAFWCHAEHCLVTLTWALNRGIQIQPEHVVLHASNTAEVALTISGCYSFG